MVRLRNLGRLPGPHRMEFMRMGREAVAAGGMTGGGPRLAVALSPQSERHARPRSHNCCCASVTECWSGGRERL
ncbi:MAG TPA: hypothetical protein VFQ79_09170 [Bryobacteraceae bacterium]|nr:hypothetical protein [Bryobacteraceae bacterium]